MRNIGRQLKTLPIWKTKIGPWLAGKPVDDAPKCGKAHKRHMETKPDGLSFRGPFANVTLEPSGDGWLARVSGNANPVSAHYAETDEAVKRWAASVWHVAIRGVILLMALAMLAEAKADPRRREAKREHHNYIIERQQAYQVQGVPTSRLIIGKREIDIYPNGLMFEKNNVVGVRGGK